MVSRCDRSADLFFIILFVREVDWWLALNSSVRHSMVALSMSHGDSMIALSMSHGDSMVALSMSHGDAVQSSEQPVCKQKGKAQQSNDPCVVVNHTYTYSKCLCPSLCSALYTKHSNHLKLTM